jgi:tRNA (cytidine/uridine-2'-O-)-methyltransferase
LSFLGTLYFLDTLSFSSVKSFIRLLYSFKAYLFEINDNRLKRAVVDYWKPISVKIYENINDFFSINNDKNISSNTTSLSEQLIKIKHTSF